MLLGEGEEEMGVIVFNRYGVSVWEDEHFLEIGGVDGCTTMWMYLMSLNCTLKMIKMVNFMLCVFTMVKKKGWNSVICYNMDECGIHFAEWNKPDTKGQILYDSTYMRYLD